MNSESARPGLLEPLRMPLRGSRLIEASAGTGKTWTIAVLYLRLVLGHGDADTAFGRALTPSEILVLTFTRAATRELSDRIRRRLLEAAQVFQGTAEVPSDDPLLSALLDAYPTGPERAAAARRLATAADNMDDAAIHTIDAWCQRMLREHAFDSGCLFDEELVADEQAMIRDAVQDHWRQQVYPLAGDTLEAVIDVWPHVGDLLSDVSTLLKWRHDLPDDRRVVDPDESLESIVRAHLRTHQNALAEIKAGWLERVEAMRGWLTPRLESTDSPFNRVKLNPKRTAGWLDALASWAATPLSAEPSLSAAAWERLHPDGLRQAGKPGRELELPSVFQALADLRQALAGLPRLAPKVRLHAAIHVLRRVAQLKQQSGTHGFDDLLRRLDEALRGPQAERLRSRILDLHPVALIDEFQDTSPLQSRIFDSLYRLSGNHSETGVFLIGDPKQSIYGFRGADIHSYLQARRATQGRHEVLGTNHRSTAEMVDAVNRLFLRAQRREGEGAFLFRSSGHDTLPFLPVAARGRNERFVTGRGPIDALTWCFDGEPKNEATSRRAFAERCAECIVEWLNDPQAGFVSADGSFTRLRPVDIAVLVRQGKEADAIRQALRRRQVASVYLSNRHSVFASREALDVVRWLRAVAEPQDARLVRAALATATVGLSLQALRRLADDDETFESHAAQFRQLRSTWQHQGVLAMLRQTLHALSLPAQWLASPDGERRLTNVMHLAELLQSASMRLDGEQALIRWLVSQVQGRSAATDEQILRLESDADLVQVVTVHKSKGLEYPLVFLPFACGARPVLARHAPVVVRVDEAGRRTLRMEVGKDDLAHADRERLREDLRLLYVAMTRARHAVWAGVGIVKPDNRKDNEVHLTALGYLLTGPDKVEADEVRQGLARLCANGGSMRLLDASGEVPRTRLRIDGDATVLATAMPYEGQFERRWAIGSFSALVRDIAPLSSLRTLAATVREDELLRHGDEPGPRSTASPPPASISSAAPWHAFPRGAVPGNFLHDQLEWLAGEDFALQDSPVLQRQLQRRCERQGWGEHAADVLAWMQALVCHRMPDVGVSLSQLDRRLPEMEFWLPSRALSAQRVDALCREHLLPGLERPALPPRELQGMLMGFADLVFEHGGRYWVLDYKSNHLGSTDADYHAQALESAVLEHRYDVQAGLYLLALHRLLRHRLGDDYRPEQQMGGAMFLFLRGLHGPRAGCHLMRPGPAFLDALDRSLDADTDNEAGAPSR